MVEKGHPTPAWVMPSINLTLPWGKMIKDIAALNQNSIDGKISMAPCKPLGSYRPRSCKGAFQAVRLPNLVSRCPKARVCEVLSTPPPWEHLAEDQTFCLDNYDPMV